MVVEMADAVGLLHFKMQREIRNPAFVFVTKPRRLTDLLAYFGDQLEIGLDLPLEAVERVLKFFG